VDDIRDVLAVVRHGRAFRRSPYYCGGDRERVTFARRPTPPGMSKHAEFLRGERVDDVLFFLHEDAVSNPEALADYADDVDDGQVLVLPGDQGRSAFQSATGIDPMGLAQAAMGTDGDVHDDCTDANCPVAEEEPDENHTTKFVFASAEAQNEEVGGIYAEGDVIHAYAVCTCGERYSDKWVVEG